MGALNRRKNGQKREGTRILFPAKLQAKKRNQRRKGIHLYNHLEKLIEMSGASRLPSLESLVFNVENRKKHQKLTDAALLEKYDQINYSSRTNRKFSIISNQNANEREELTYEAHLHLVEKSTTGEFSFAFISASPLPSLKEIELFLRQNIRDSKSPVQSTTFAINHNRKLDLKRSQLSLIYNFNVNFMQDFLQEGTQARSLSFSEFQDLCSTSKFLQVILLSNPKVPFSTEQPEIDYSLLKSFSSQKEIKQCKSQRPLIKSFSQQYLDFLSLIQNQQIINSLQNSQINLFPSSPAKIDIYHACQELNIDSLNQKLDHLESSNQTIITENALKDKESQPSDFENSQQNLNSDPQTQSSEEQETNQAKKQQWELDQDWFDEPDQLPLISQMSKNIPFKENIQQCLYRHRFLPQDFFRVIQIFDPLTQSMKDIVDEFSKLLGVPFDAARSKLNLSKNLTDQNDETIFNCIFKNPDKFLSDHSQIFHVIRKHFMISQGWNQEEDTYQDFNLRLQLQKKQQSSQQKQNNLEANNTDTESNPLPKFNRRNPLVLCKKVCHLKNFDFLNEINIKNNLQCLQSPLDMGVQDSKLTYSLIPIEYLEEMVISSNTIETLLQGISVLQCVKDIMITNELSVYFGLESCVNPELLIESCSLPSYSKTKNLELLEVIGDVVIKYISSLFLVQNLQTATESTLTFLRSNYINNIFLGITAFQNGLHFFTKSKKPSLLDWKNNFIANNLSEGQQDSQLNDPHFLRLASTTKLNYSNLSDQLESVIGAFYASNNYEILRCLDLSNRLGLMIDNGLYKKCPLLVEGSFLMSKPLRAPLQIHLDMTYSELHELVNSEDYFRRILGSQNQSTSTFSKQREEQKLNYFAWDTLEILLAKSIMEESSQDSNAHPMQLLKNRRSSKESKKTHNKYLLEIVTRFEQECIQYTFKNKQLLIKALNCNQNLKSPEYEVDYQVLEFLGDSLIEILVVTNAYDFSRTQLGQIASPYFFCEMKSLLLSNDFMSRMAVLRNFHHFALNLSSTQKSDMINFVNTCNLQAPYRFPVTHFANSPKVLGDLWESVAGAILEDAGISEFTRIYGRFYSPFIQHFVTFYEKIVFNEKEKVQLVAQLTYSQLECVTELQSVEPQEGVGVLKNSSRKMNNLSYTWNKQIKLHHSVVGEGTDLNEQLAEKKAYHNAYQNIFILKNTNLGLVYQGNLI